MKNKKWEEAFNLPTVDDLFESTHGDYLGRIEKIELSRIKEFKGHPFKVKDDEEMDRLVESIKENGILNPIILRDKGDKTLEIVSGHRRKRAAELADMDTIPSIVRNLTDEEATILMVDSNLQREELLPSEKAFAYKMKMEAMSRQGQRNDLTSTPLEPKLRTNEKIGEEVGESREQIRRYIRLTNLIPQLLEMVDEKKIAFRPAVELSYLTEEEQYVLLDSIEFSDATPSLAQAINMKKRSAEGSLTAEEIEEIMLQQKPNQVEKIKINKSRIESVLPKKNMTEKQVEEFIITCIQEHVQRMKKQKQIER